MQEYDPPQVRLKPGRDKSVRDRHPWIFSGAIAGASDGIAEGDIVAVASDSGEILGAGFAFPDQSLAVRLFHFGACESAFDETFLTSRLEAALAFRESLPDFQRASFRLANAEADLLPGLIIDVLDQTAIVQFRAAGYARFESALARFLTERLGMQHVLDRSGEDRKSARSTRNMVASGSAPDRIEFKENGLSYTIDLQNSQKTGHYLDQKENRVFVERAARNRRVLDAFCYTGGFSLHALRGGASRVLSLDASERAVQQCRENVARNFPGETRHEANRGDALEILPTLADRQFDLMVLDPPAFAKSRAAVAGAARGYKDINLRALRSIAHGGRIFTFSCSQYITRELFRKIIFSAAADAGRNVRIERELGAAPDHPLSLFHPEGEYLKGLALYVD